MIDISKTLEYESGYSNDENDAGGETKYGISKRQYPTLDIKNLTKEQAIEIYRKDFYERMNLNLIKPELEFVAWKLFDIGVNQGPGTAIRFLQNILDIKEDGILGRDTATTINQYSDPKGLCQMLAIKQMLRYTDIVIKKPSQLVFFKGWIKRALDY